MGSADSRWDKVYPEGKLNELFNDLLFTGVIKSARVPQLQAEMKSDLQYANTKRMYVETAGKRQKTNGWAPSGVFDAELDSHILVYNLSGLLIIAPVEAWRYIVMEHGEERAGGDAANPTMGRLLTPDQFHRGFWEWAHENPELWKQYIPEENLNDN